MRDRSTRRRVRTEVGTIVPRVAKATDVTEVHRIIHEEFGRWFGANTGGPLATYEAPAREIWQAVLSFRAESNKPLQE